MKYDYESYPHRLLIADLHPNMKNVSLLGRIQDMKANVRAFVHANMASLIVFVSLFPN